VRLSGGRQGSDTRPVVGGTATFTNYDVGSNSATTLTATPLTTFDLPPIAAGSSEGQSRAVTAHGVGAPGLSLTETNTSNSMRVTASVTPNGDGTQTLIGFSDVSAEACVPSGSATSQQFEAQAFKRKTVWACAEHTFNGKQGFGVTRAEISARPVGNVEAPTGMTFQVSSTASGNAQSGYTYALQGTHSDPGAKPFDDARLVYYVNGNRRDAFAPEYNRPDDQWTARWCDSFLGFDSNCSDPIAISPASGSASTPVSVGIQNLPSCRSTDESAPTWDPRWPNLTYEVTSQIGGAAGAITHVDYTVAWTGKLSPLKPITVRQNCEQISAPQPTPTDDTP
jgi:hypothetical protein